MLYDHLEKGYQAVVVRHDIEEALDLIQADKKQLFYFDDFMGSAFLGAHRTFASRNEDRAILDFIKMVRKSHSARLVLTTREHIFAQASERSERFRNSEIVDLRVSVQMPGYTLLQRAELLYNHIYFSDLPKAFRRELLRGDFYLEISEHPKYNPPIIEWLTTYRRLRRVAVDDYRTFVRNLLRDPSEIWRHAYDRQIGEPCRSLLLALFSMSGTATIQILKGSFASLHAARAHRYGFGTRADDFKLALRELEGAFISSESHRVGFLNPSVFDFMGAVVRDAPENAMDILGGALGFDQIERLWSYAESAGTDTIVRHFTEESDRLAGYIWPHLREGRRTDLGDGAVGYRGTTFEHRLMVLIEMARRLRNTRLSDLIDPLCHRMVQEWNEDTINVGDAIECLRATNNSTTAIVPRKKAICDTICEGLVRGLAKGCWSHELRGVVSILSIAGTHQQALRRAARWAFRRFEERLFHDELAGAAVCGGHEDILDNLKFLQKELGMRTEKLRGHVEVAMAEADENDYGYYDDIGSARGEPAMEDGIHGTTIRQMFESLGEDEE